MCTVCDGVVVVCTVWSVCTVFVCMSVCVYYATPRDVYRWWWRDCEFRLLLLLLGLGWCVVVVRCVVVVVYPLRRTDRARLVVHDISL